MTIGPQIFTIDGTHRVFIGKSEKNQFDHSVWLWESKHLSFIWESYLKIRTKLCGLKRWVTLLPRQVKKQLAWNLYRKERSCCSFYFRLSNHQTLFVFWNKTLKRKTDVYFPIIWHYDQIDFRFTLVDEKSMSPIDSKNLRPSG